MDLSSGVKKREAAVLAEDGQERGRSSFRSGCVCSCSGRGAACPAQSSWSGAQTDMGCRIPDAKGTSICGEQWVTA